MKDKEINKEDFEVYDKNLDTDGSYKSLGGGRWYNHEMYEDALIEAGLYSPKWFNKSPVYLKYIFYFIGGIILGYLLNYVLNI